MVQSRKVKCCLKRVSIHCHSGSDFHQCHLPLAKGAEFGGQVRMCSKRFAPGPMTGLGGPFYERTLARGSGNGPLSNSGRCRSARETVRVSYCYRSYSTNVFCFTAPPQQTRFRTAFLYEYSQVRPSDRGDKFLVIC